VTDLETLIRNKQDQLRGRPEDWTDRLIHWLHTMDWMEVVDHVGMFVVIFCAMGMMVGCSAPWITTIMGER
jgi:hypothetical protein